MTRTNWHHVQHRLLATSHISAAVHASVPSPFKSISTTNGSSNPTMQRLLAFVLHAIAAGIMAWGWFGLLDMNIPELARMGGYYQFLTNQGLIVTWLCMVISLFCDVFPSVTVTRRIKRVLLMVSLPLDFVITSIYWSLLFFLPHLILLPTTLSATKPGVLPRPPGLSLPVDLALHAAPLCTVLIDFFAFEPKFPKQSARKVATVAIVGFSVWYASFVEYCASFNDSFPYPFLTYSPLPVRVLIYSTTTGIALGCFSTLNALHA